MISPFVQGTYPAGALFTAMAIFSVKSEVGKARGLEKLVACAPAFFAVPLAMFGAQHLSDARAIMQLVPKWMPWRLFWAYFVGFALFAAALSILLKRKIRLSATLLGIMFFIFVATMDLPGVARQPGNRFSWAFMLRELSFGAAAWALAGTQMELQGARGASVMKAIGRYVIAIGALFYGVENILHPGFAPVVPLEKPTPTWVPGHLLWAYFAGAVLLVTGAMLLVNRKTRAAATFLGAVALLVTLCVYMPVLVATPLDIDPLNYFADTLFYAGAILLLAGAMPKIPSPANT
jgi:uncharacterized membrane protein